MIISFPGNTEAYSMEEELPPFLDISFKGFFKKKCFPHILYQIKNPRTVLHHTDRFFMMSWMCSVTSKKPQKVKRNQYLN